MPSIAYLRPPTRHALARTVLLLLTTLLLSLGLLVPRDRRTLALSCPRHEEVLP